MEINPSRLCTVWEDQRNKGTYVYAQAYLIQGGQLGSGMINGNLTRQEILSLASENYYTKDRTWTGGEVTTGGPQTTDTKGTFNGDVAFCHSEPLFIF